jgi:hypothetical protein
MYEFSTLPKGTRYRYRHPIFRYFIIIFLMNFKSHLLCSFYHETNIEAHFKVHKPYRLVFKGSFCLPSRNHRVMKCGWHHRSVTSQHVVKLPAVLTPKPPPPSTIHACRLQHLKPTVTKICQPPAQKFFFLFTIPVLDETMTILVQNMCGLAVWNRSMNEFLAVYKARSPSLIWQPLLSFIK